MEEGTAAGTTLVPSQLATLVPTYDPSKDDLQVYCQKVELLTATWPDGKYSELATRLILGCQGTAFMKLQLCREEVTKNERKSIQRIIELLGGQWGAIPLEKKFEAAERALYRCLQKSDESNDSYLARADVLWQELTNQGTKLEELQAYIILRGSNLGPEDKKKVLINSEAQNSGKLSMKEVSSAIRFLGAGFFHEVTTGKKTSKLRTYDSTALIADEIEPEEAQTYVMEDDQALEEEFVEALVADGDDDALLVSEFETAVSDVIQEDAELASAYSAYTDARKRLAEKFRHRGFFPSSFHNSGKGKGRLGKFKSKGGKGNRSWGGQRKDLQSRILNSNCRICGKRGHWKAECPLKDSGSQSAASAPSNLAAGSLQTNFAGVAVTDAPDELPLEFFQLQEFGPTALHLHDLDPSAAINFSVDVTTIDEPFLHEGVIFHVDIMDAKGKLRETLKRIHHRDNQDKDNRAQSLNHAILNRLFIRKSLKQSPKTVSDSDQIPGAGILPVSPQRILSNRNETALVAHDYSQKAEGVLDSGATKTVIGSQLVGPLLKALDPNVRSQVSRSTCQVTFRFGNMNTLDARQALVVPVGPLNLHIAIVPGNTPFLISNTLMRTLKAIVDTEQQLLHSPLFQKPVKLKLSPRGLFLLDINDLVHSSAKRVHTDCQDTFAVEAEKKPCVQADSIVEPLKQKQDLLETEDVETNKDQESEITKESFQTTNNDVDTRIPGDVSSVVLASRESLIAPSFVVDPHLAADHGRQLAPTFAAPSCSSGGTSAGRPQQVQSAPDAEHDRRFWSDPQREVLPDGMATPSKVGSVDLATLPRQQESIPPSHRALLSHGDREMRTGGTCDPTHRCSKQLQGPDACGASNQGQSQGQTTDSCTGTSSQQPRSTIGPRSRHGRVLMGACSTPHGGGGDLPGHSGCRSRHVAEPNGSHREHAESGRESHPEESITNGALKQSCDWWTLHAGDLDCEEVVNFKAVHDLGHDSDIDRFRRLVNQYSQELNQHKNFTKSNRHDLFEVFCGSHSQLTQQCRNLEGKAQRFNRDRCDLQSTEGRFILFEELHKCRPAHLWFAPSCGPWCLFSNLNGSRSIQAWEEMQQSRRAHLEQVALGVVLLRFQLVNGNHMHWEQPKGSLMFKLPLLKELFETTAAAEFDMCQFGLVDPDTGLPIRKSMIVMTSSYHMFQYLHGKTCNGNHSQHQRIEGSVRVGETRIQRSQITENYPRKFARQVATVLTKKRHDDIKIKEPCYVSLARSFGEAVPTREVKKPRLSSQFQRAKGEISRVSEPSATEPPKRRRLDVKQNPLTIHQCWLELINRCNPLIPRVGKIVIEDPNILQEAQDLIADKCICFIVAGRGTDRTVTPCKETAIGEAPFRKSVFIHRVSNKLFIEDEWEHWDNLSRRQQVRSSHPCKLCITIFARNPDESTAVSSKQQLTPSQPEVLKEDEPIVAPSSDINVDPQINPTDAHDQDLESLGPIQKIDANSSQHGPKFLALSKENQQAIIKAHTNLGHPSCDRLKVLFRQQGVDVSVIDGIDDLRCSTCAMQTRPKLSRPATIRPALDFNDRIAVDGLKFTNQLGQVYHVYHIIDMGTSFHTAIIAPSRTSESAIQCLIQAWLCWAGAPVELVIDSASELNSEAFTQFLQQYGIKCVTTVPDAHWQNGRAERHGAILEDMLQKIDREFPINSYSQLQRCLWHATQAKNASSLRKGFSPEILVFGKALRLPGSICGDDQLPAHGLADSETGQGIQFREQLNLRESARKAFHQADNSAALRRALLRRSRPHRGHLQAGEWIMLWKVMGNQKGWFGPMQVVIQENDNTVWLSWCGKLFRGAPENIRPVSAYEARNIDHKTIISPSQVSQLQEQIANQNPLEGNRTIETEDVAPEIPDVIAEPNPVSLGNDSSNPSVIEPEAEGSTAGVSDPSPIEPDAANIPVPSDDEGLLCIGLESIDDSPTMFVEDDLRNMAWRIEVNITDQEIEEWRNESNPTEMCFLASATKRARAEVKLTSLSTQDKEEFHKAKKNEVMNWLSTDTVCRMLRNQLPPQEILRCRWVLTWKPIEEQDRDPKNPRDRKAKARLVVLGYLDPSIEKLNRDSPTLSKHSRMVLLQLIASSGWILRSFDIKAAFLQGKTQEGRIIGIEPVPELISAMGLKSNEVCRLKKSAYGLIDAPFLWFQTLNEELIKIGFEPSPFDPCLYVLRKSDGTPRGVIGVHVDDGLCGGDSEFMARLAKLQEKYPFGSQKISDFIFTGIHLHQRSDMGIVLSQSDYVRKILPIAIESNRRSQIEEKVNEDERQQLRALIGSLQYASVNTRPDLASRLSFLQSQVNQASVGTLIEANKTLHEAKRHHDVEITVQPIAREDLRFLAFSDASFASKASPDSHTGCIILSTHKEIVNNALCPVSPISWGCKKIQRVVTSTLSAETMSLATTLDQLSWVKLFWGWLLDPKIQWRKPEGALRQLPDAVSTATFRAQQLDSSVAATDCKSLFDLVTRTAPPNCGEFRTQLQARSIKDLLSEGTKLRWVHSGAQLADALTKIMEASFLRETLKIGKYKLHDELAILKQRSHNRTRLKWLRENNSDQDPPETLLWCSDHQCLCDL